MSLPDANTIVQASELYVLDSDGKQVSFGSLIRDTDTVVLLPDLLLSIAGHFFCGRCQAYVTQLSTIRQESLEKANKKLLIIGCGDYQPIKAYSERSGYEGPIYADPSRSLFRKFGLLSNLETAPQGEKKKSYLTDSYLSNLLTSLWQGPLKHPTHIGKNGNISQLGGEFIFTKDGQCTFAARMKHTQDHMEVADLMREAGVEYP